MRSILNGMAHVLQRNTAQGAAGVALIVEIVHIRSGLAAGRYDGKAECGRRYALQASDEQVQQRNRMSGSGNTGRIVP